MARRRILILGAAGRDFHDFNVVFRRDPAHEVVAFTAQQIPHIENRRYPAELAGELYPEGIPVYAEDRLEEVVRERGVDACVMAYSDLPHVAVMHLASRANAAGADFLLLAAERTMLESRRPAVAVCASRTGAGKSPVARAVVRVLRAAGRRVAVLRHPMPYGDLARQAVQRFATYDDLERYETTIEEREEYEPHIAAGSVVYAGVDYEAILRRAEAEADVLVWEGGNNDTSFLRASVYVTIVDPHRAGDELTYYPGETNVRLADVVLVSKVDTAPEGAVQRVRANARALNPRARIVEAALPITVEDAEVLRGKRVLAVEDGPTLTHGEMRYGAATLAARQAGAARLVDPRPYAAGELREVLDRYPEMGPLLPAMGYGAAQIRDLEETIRRAAADQAEAVAIGTPIDLGRLISIPIPHTRVTYECEVRGRPDLREVLAPLLAADG